MTKDGLDKTNMFLKYDGQVLRFLAVEVPSRSPPYFPVLEAKLEEEVSSRCVLLYQHVVNKLAN